MKGVGWVKIWREMPQETVDDYERALKHFAPDGLFSLHEILFMKCTLPLESAKKKLANAMENGTKWETLADVVAAYKDCERDGAQWLHDWAWMTAQDLRRIITPRMERAWNKLVKWEVQLTTYIKWAATSITGIVEQEDEKALRVFFWANQENHKKAIRVLRRLDKQLRVVRKAILASGNEVELFGKRGQVKRFLVRTSAATVIAAIAAWCYMNNYRTIAVLLAMVLFFPLVSSYPRHPATRAQTVARDILRVFGLLIAVSLAVGALVFGASIVKDMLWDRHDFTLEYPFFSVAIAVAAFAATWGLCKVVKETWDTMMWNWGDTDGK